jgi:hypothetical protein
VQNPLEHPHFNSLVTKRWALALRNELTEWLRTHLPSLSSPSLFHWYAHFKKKMGPHQNGPSMENVELEEMKDKFLLL